MEWKYLIFSFIDVDFLLKLFYKDNELFKKIITQYIKKYYNVLNKKIIFNNIFLEFINIYPRIDNFDTELLDERDSIYKIISSNKNSKLSRYIYNGIKPSPFKFIDFNKFIHSNIILPSYKNSSIPFTFGITKNNNFKLIMSNVYYFEIYLDQFDFRTPFPLFETLKIGFANVLSDSKNINFGKKNSFGFDIIDNQFISTSQKSFIPKIISKGDTIGIGLIYNGIYSKTPFLTVNGKLIDIDIKPLIIKYDLKVILSMRMSTGIDINFGTQNFKFDIENHINKSKLIYFSKNNFVNNGFNNKRYLTSNIISKSQFQIVNENIYNLIP